MSLQVQRIGHFPKPGGIAPDVAQQIDAFNKTVDQFNKDASGYVSDVAGMYTDQPKKGISWLENVALQVQAEIDNATTAFAEATWRNAVETQRVKVLRAMGYDKGFMVLKPYALRPIPEWARGPIQQSAYDHVYNDVFNRSIGGFSSGYHVYTWNTWTRWTGILGAVHKDMIADLIAGGMPAGQAMAYANNNARAVANQICAQGSAIVATDVAYEWVNRPWPYEITPPETASDENSAGWLKKDRPKYFTFLVGATSTDANKARFTLANVLGTPDTTIATFAQAEVFTWMEYNNSYGGGDRYNRVSDYGHNVWSGSPAPWRLSTQGGWAWQPRLAVSDQLAPALQNNPDFQSQFESAGVPGVDETALKALIMH
jgi:hypothetical protein